MATNLSIENLTSVLGTGDTEKFMGGMGSVQTSEAQVIREMRKNGMDVAGAGEGGTPPLNPNTFSAILRDSIDKVNTYQTQADTAIKEAISGRSKNLHETMLAIERADSSLKLMMQVRNKVLDAYKEIIRMQV
jgi:flagellar hook-basal body complex protein FliE